MLDKVISSSASKELTDAQVAELLGLVDRSLLFSFLEGMVKGEPDVCLEVVAQVYDYGYELSEFTGDLLELVRNATFVRLSERSRKHVDVSADEIARLEQIVAGVAPEALTRVFNALLDTHDQVSRASRPRIVLEMAVARLATVRPVEPVSALVARLEDLERRLRPMSGSKTAPRSPAPRESRVREPAPAKAAPAPKAAPPKAPAKARKPAPQPIEEEPPPPEDGHAHFDQAPPMDLDGAPLSDVGTRWRGLGRKLAAFGAGGERLAAAKPSMRGDVLVLAVPAGRALAEARRARGMPEVEGVVRSAFPKIRSIEVAPLAGTGTPADHERALRAQVLDEPELRRIVQKLGAEIESVTSLRDDDPSQA
jgi:hypothetical protein